MPENNVIPKWIKFVLIEQKEKTEVWAIHTKDFGTFLGTVKWFPSWRKYAFFPDASTVYEQDCLRDIANFIENEMEKRKKK